MSYVVLFIFVIGLLKVNVAQAGSYIKIGYGDKDNFGPTWQITVPANNSVEILLLDINLPCNENELKLFSVNETGDREQIAHFCGIMPEVAKTAETLVSKISNKNVTLELYDKIGDPAHRAYLRYELFSHSTSSSVITPNTSDGMITVNQSLYKPSVDYSWLLQTSYPNQILHLKFYDFDIEKAGSSGTCYDYLLVYDGNSDNFPVLGKYCGVIQELTVSSTSRFMFVKFHSDVSKTATGFSAAYYAVFRDNTGSPGRIQLNPSTPKAYTSVDGDDVYLWFLHAPLGYGITGNWHTKGFGRSAHLSFYNGRVDTRSTFHSNFNLKYNATGVLQEQSYMMYLIVKVEIARSAARQTNSSDLLTIAYEYRFVSDNVDTGAISVLNPWLISTEDLINSNHYFITWVFQPRSKSYIKIHTRNLPPWESDLCLDEGFIMVEEESKFVGPFCSSNSNGDGWEFLSHGSKLKLIFFSFKTNPGAYKLIIEQTDCQGFMLDDSKNGGSIVNGDSFNATNSTTANCWVWQYFVNSQSGPHFQYLDIKSDVFSKLIDTDITTTSLTMTATNSKCSRKCMDYFVQFSGTPSCSVYLAGSKSHKEQWIGFASSCSYAQASFSLTLRKYNGEDETSNLPCSENFDCGMIIRPTACGAIQFEPGLDNQFCEWGISLNSDISAAFREDMSHFLLTFSSVPLDACSGSLLIYEIIETGTFKYENQFQYIHSHEISPHCESVRPFPIHALSVGEIKIRYAKPAGYISKETTPLQLEYKLLRKEDMTEPEKCSYSYKGYSFGWFWSSWSEYYSFEGNIFPQTGSCYSIGEEYGVYYGYYGLPDILPKLYFGLRTKKTTWNNASNECEDWEGGHLVTINTEEEYWFFMSLFQNKWKTLTFKYAPYVAVHIGLQELKDGTYRWVDGNPLTFTRWYNPNNVSTIYRQSEFQTVFGDHDAIPNDLLKIMFPHLYQPSWDPSAHCVVMIVKNPYIGGVWVKIPCNYQLSHSFVACEFDEWSEPFKEDEITYGISLPLCPVQWNYIAGKCIKVIKNLVTTLFINATKMCQGNQGSLASLEKGDLAEINYYLHLWKIDAMQKTKHIWLESGQDNDLCIALVEQNSTWGFQSVNCNDTNIMSYIILCEHQVVNIEPGCKWPQFMCYDGTCISPGNVCDREHNCKGGEDELNCQECGVTSFRCSTNDECVSMTAYCDYNRDCLDGSDEMNCYYPECSFSQYRCGDGTCISENRTCDFIPDCRDGSDESEEFCSWTGSCRKHGGFECYSGKCIPNIMLHDTQIDCIGNNQEDEINKIGQENTLADVCMDQQAFLCSDGSSCCPFHQLCIYDFDSFNKTTGCKNFEHLQGCQNFSCPGMFKCPNSFCVPINFVCNGRRDCINGYDEKNCNTYTCPSGYFQCKGEKWCLDQTKVCDGKVDCKSGDDENFCELTAQCPPSCKCVGYTMDCGSGELQTLPSVSRHMRAIFVSQNKLYLSSKTFVAHYFVGKLDLSWNGLRKLPENVFADMRNLLELVLSGNYLTVLEGSRFAIQALTFLDISQNLLTEIANDAFSDISYLQILNLTNNPPEMSIGTKTFDSIQIKSLMTDSFRYCCLVKGKNSTHCTPEADEFSTCTNLLSNEGLRIFVWVLGLVAFIGNTFVLIWRIKTEGTKLKVNSLFVMNLGISDFLMGVYLLIIASADAYYYWHRDEHPYFLEDLKWKSGSLCQLAGFIATLSSEMSVSMLVIITIDRFIVTVLAFKVEPMSVKFAVILLLITWTVWMLMSALPFFGIAYFGNNDFYGRNAVCLAFTLSTAQSQGWEFTLAVFLIFNFVAFLLIALGYLAIFCHVKQSSKAVGRKQTSRDIALTRKLSLIVGTDFICWFPIVVAGFIALSGVNIPPEFSAWVAVFILPINSAINPILYTLSSIQCAAKCKKKKANHSDSGTSSTRVTYHSTVKSISESTPM